MDTHLYSHRNDGPTHPVAMVHDAFATGEVPAAHSSDNKCFTHDPLILDIFASGLHYHALNLLPCAE